MTDQDEVEEQGFRMEDLRSGSPYAFSDFFLYSFPGFFSFADFLLHDKLSAKNATAGAFFQLWPKLRDFDSPEQIKAFLYTAIRDNCLDYLKYLQVDPLAKAYSPQLQFAASLPPGILQDLLSFTERFEPGQ
jgi:DNA-directed RNA polymerase specialized sigma24 family protein